MATPFQELKHAIRKAAGLSVRVYAFKELGTDKWFVQAIFNATTAVAVNGITYEDFTEDFLADDLTAAILDQREGGHFREMTYKQAKELTKALQTSKEI